MEAYDDKRLIQKLQSQKSMLVDILERYMAAYPAFRYDQERLMVLEEIANAALLEVRS